MKKNILLILLCVSEISLAGVFLEPLAVSDRLYRGRAPKASEMTRLKETGITTVLIFKNQTKNEVDTEI